MASTLLPECAFVTSKALFALMTPLLIGFRFVLLAGIGPISSPKMLSDLLPGKYNWCPLLLNPLVYCNMSQNYANCCISNVSIIFEIQYNSSSSKHDLYEPKYPLVLAIRAEILAYYMVKTLAQEQRFKFVRA